MFNYYLEGVQHNNSLVDIHITAVEQGVINRSVPANIRDVINLPDWIHKIESTDKKTTSIDVKKTTEKWRKCMNRTIHKKL